MTNGKQLGILSIVIVTLTVAAALTGCGESLCRDESGAPIECSNGGPSVDCFDPITGAPTGFCGGDAGMPVVDSGVTPDNGVINCPANICADGTVPTPGSDGICRCQDTPPGTVSVTGMLRSGREFVTTGMVGSESCAPIIVGAGIEQIAGTSCTVTGQVVTCTGVPADGEFFTIHGCVSVNGGAPGFVHPVDNTPGCPTPGQDYVSLTTPGGAVVGVNTSTTGGIYCRNTVALDY